MSSGSTALLEGEQLLGTECLVMDLRGGFDQILKVGTGEEVPEVDKFTVVLVFDVDHSPSVLTSTNLLSADNDGFLRPNNSEWDDVLYTC